MASGCAVSTHFHPPHTHIYTQRANTQFVKDHIRDPVDGEWLWSTNAAGDAPGKDGYDYQKGNKWCVGAVL